MRIRRSFSLLLAAAAAAATMIGTAGPAAAAGPVFHRGFGNCEGNPPVPANLEGFDCVGRWTYGSSWVDVWWGFVFNPDNNHLRAYGQLVTTNSSIRNRADALNLGDLNGVLVSEAGVAQGTLSLQTDPAVSCHYPSGIYVANLHYSIRWPDNTLTSGQQTGQQTGYADPMCVPR